MKKTSIITLLLLLLLTLAVATACVSEGEPPAGSDGETTETTPETETTLADIPAADALDQLMAAQESDSSADAESMDNGKIDVDMTMGINVSMDGVQNSTTIPVQITVIMDGENMKVDGNLMGSATNMTYQDGVLYITAMDTDLLNKVKCPVTPEEFELVAGLIFGVEEDTDGSETDDTPIPDIPGMEDLKPSDLFSTVVSELDATNGSLLITGKGFNTALSSDLAPLIQPMLESMGLVGGGEWDENGELVTDPAATLAEVIGLLAGLNEETMQITFIFDRDGNLESTSMDITIAVEETDGYTTSKTELRIQGSFAVEVGGQTVEAPADADSYTEEDWRVIFGMETAEMLDLIPDAENCVTLSSNKDIRERQILYVYNHYEEFVNNGVLFHVEGYLIETYEVDEETATVPAHIGAYEGLISLCDPHGEEEDYTTVFSFQIPLSAKGEGYPPTGSFVKAKYCKLTLVEDSVFGSYMYLTLTDFIA